jgi:hypothetical protein
MRLAQVRAARGDCVADNSEKHADDGQPNSAKFDWVSQRFACSLPAVFKTLRLQVEEDVKKRNALRPKFAVYEFSVADNDDGFVVTLEANKIHKTVRFRLADHAICVCNDRGESMFDVTLSFNDRGECQMNVQKERLDYWQVRRLALEDLLFHSN